MTATADLYDLLPAIYRIRDAEEDGALAALTAVLAAEADVVDRDIQGLYDDLFIETCRPWVVPYIADLLDVRGLYAVAPGTASQRAYVANTIGYRRRKGTLAVLEQLAYDVTGWRAKAVEFFQLLATTQYAKHVRLANVRPDLRDADGLELLDGPFARAAHSGEVRRIPSGRGRHNIPNIGLYLWRLQSYPIERGTARQIGPPVDERYTFNPLGLDEPLFNPPRTDTAIEDLAQEIDVPVELRRRALFDELEARRQAEVENRTPAASYFRENEPVFRIFTRATPTAAFVEVPADEILVADLSLWQLPPTSKQYTPAGSATAQPKAMSVAVDPKLGRITFPSGTGHGAVEVDYAYGFSGDMGGGPYDRSSLVDASFAARVTWQAGVGKDVTLVPQQIFANIGDAVTAWSSQPPGTAGVIAVLDSRTYEETLAIDVPEGSELLIVAADWPVRDVLGTPTRTIGEWVPQGRRSHLAGDISGERVGARGERRPRKPRPRGPARRGRSDRRGLGTSARLTVADCTLVPAEGGLAVNSTNASGKRNAGLTVIVERSICGPSRAGRRRSRPDRLRQHRRRSRRGRGRDCADPVLDALRHLRRAHAARGQLDLRRPRHRAAPAGRLRALLLRPGESRCRGSRGATAASPTSRSRTSRRPNSRRSSRASSPSSRRSRTAIRPTGSSRAAARPRSPPGPRTPPRWAPFRP